MCIDGVTGLVASLMSLSSAECEWGSMMPGVSHMPVPSTTAAEDGAFTAAPTAAILPACTHTDPCSMVPWLAVITVAFLMTISEGEDGTFCWARQGEAKTAKPTNDRHRADRRRGRSGAKMCIK